MGFYTVSSSPSVSLNLLDPVIIDDKANLLNVYAENGSGKYAPAIVLYFIERKADAKSTVEAIQTAVDVATLLIPGSQATMTLRILNYADKASSVASILSTATAEDYPELSKVLNVTSLVLGVADFSTNGVQSLKNLNSNPSNAVNLINRSENVLDAGNHIQNVENLAMRILDETPDELMNQVLHSSNPHSRALLEDVLEKERHLAQGADRTDVVAKLDEALEVVREVRQPGLQWIDEIADQLPSDAKPKIIEWINNGLDGSKLQAAFEEVTDKATLFNNLDNAKSIYHQRITINDRVNQIPGIQQGMNQANGLPRKEIQPPSNLGLPETFKLTENDAPNFTDAQIMFLPAGQKLYRVIGTGAYKTGAYWTREIPANYAEIIGGTAVRPEWNGMEQIVVYTVPEDGIYVWIGGAAQQQVTDQSNMFFNSIKNYHLPGGAEQVYMPNVYRDYLNPSILEEFERNANETINITWVKN